MLLIIDFKAAAFMIIFKLIIITITEEDCHIKRKHHIQTLVFLNQCLNEWLEN